MVDFVFDDLEIELLNVEPGDEDDALRVARLLAAADRLTVDAEHTLYQKIGSPSDAFIAALAKLR